METIDRTYLIYSVRDKYKRDIEEMRLTLEKDKLTISKIEGEELLKDFCDNLKEQAKGLEEQLPEFEKTMNRRIEVLDDLINKVEKGNKTVVSTINEIIEGLGLDRLGVSKK